MASVKLKHTSGNGTILHSPAANPTNDVTLKLPSTSGTAGQVLKVASANHSATNAELEFAGGGKFGNFSQTLNNYNYSTSSTSLTDVLSASGVTAEYAMTPSLSTSQILFTANMFINALNVSQQEHRYQLSIQAKIGSGSYSEIEAYNYLGQYNYMQSGLQMNSIPIPFSFLYSPSTTLTVTFKMQVKTYSGSASLNFNNADKASQINLYEVLV